MNSLLCSLTLVASLAMGIAVRAAEDTPLTIYGVSVSGKQVVAVRFQTVNGKPSMSIRQRLPLEFLGRAIAYHAHRHQLYVAPNRPKDDVPTDGLLIQLDAGGKMQKGKKIQFAHGSDYLSLDRSERFLLSASYFEGTVDVYSLDAKGLPEKVVSSLYNGRDKSHAVLTSRDNRFAYVPYVKDQNSLYQYSFNDKTGKLVPLKHAQAKVPMGVGPRHIAFHPTKPFVFFSNEQQLGVSSYSMDDQGGLKLLQVCDPLDTKPGQGLAASDIVITPDGRWIYASVRGFGRELNAVFRYEVLANGKLKAVGKTDTDTIPWALGLSPSGSHLFVSATQGGTLTAYKINEKGDLKKLAATAWGKGFRDFVVVK
jgi:6-phosphogluconolactonase